MIVLSAIAIYTAAWLILFSTFRKRQTPSAVFRIYTREPIASIDAQLAGHIVLSIVAYSLLTLATLQAILLNYQNNQLKQHHAKAVIGIFPPLQTMESLMFYMVWAGFILLSLSIPTGLVNISDRQTFGWRGKVAIRWVIAGFVMLMLAYFGSKFVIEFILS